LALKLSLFLVFVSWNERKYNELWNGASVWDGYEMYAERDSKYFSLRYVPFGLVPLGWVPSFVILTVNIYV
jgi:hypothetical protein